MAVPAHPSPATLVFDVNETLTDQSLFADRLAEAGAPPDLASTWYAATLRDGIALSLLHRARPYADVGREVLSGLLHSVPVTSGTAEAAVDHVIAGFDELGLQPDVVAGVQDLAMAGHRLVTLSNGNPRIARGVFARAGIGDAFDLLLGAEDAGAWKPHPRAYRHAAERTGIPTRELVMVAVHPWDLAGAAAVGMRTVYIDRTGAPWPASFPSPDIRVDALTDLAAALAAS